MLYNFETYCKNWEKQNYQISEKVPKAYKLPKMKKVPKT